MSVEALVLRDEYSELFSDEIRKVCKERLEQYGYSVIKMIIKHRGK